MSIAEMPGGPAGRNSTRPGRQKHDKSLRLLRPLPLGEAVNTKKLMVEQYINGSMAILCRGKKMKFREIAARPEKPLKQPTPRIRKAVPPAKDHPWRRPFFVPKKLKTKTA
jgi:hypothetical protein